MSSLVVESRVLDAYSEQFVIGVVNSKLLVACDLLSSYQPEATNDKGQLRVLSRSFCGAEEFQVFVAIPFHCHSACSTHSGNSPDFNTSKAIYTLDTSNRFIWAFAYGIYDKEQSPHQWMFRIDAVSGEYTNFKIDQLQTAESGRWEVCTDCRATKLQFVGRDSRVQFILHDSNLIGYEFDENSLVDVYHHSDTFQSIAISVDLESNRFDMTCSEHKFPSRSEPFDCPIQPLNSILSEWCWIVNDTLVVYNIHTQHCNAFLPKSKASKRMRKSSSHHLKLVKQPRGLRLAMEPQLTHPNDVTKASFHIYDIHLCMSDKTFDLTKVKQSKPVPRSLLQLAQSSYIPQSETHLQDGILYKFYANHCLTMFLRMPTLQEAAFVGLQKLWMREEDGVLRDGISHEQLIEKLDINATWF